MTVTIDRRSLLRGAAVGAAAALTPGSAVAVDEPRADPLSVGMLYDATRCIGCRSCQVACRRANSLATERGALWDDAVALTADTKTVIQSYRGPEGSSFVKRQCMHCVDPGCVSVCMIRALHKTEAGLVAYDPSRCIGCRYCQVACPFDVPRFEWNTATPEIVKCELCRHLLANGGRPACCDVCPTGALIFGRRAELLEEAHRRLAADPELYYPKVYGENDGGGTQVLYLSAVPFEKLGLPDLGDEPVPRMARAIQHGIYKGFVAPVALYAILTIVMLRNRRPPTEDEEPEKETV